MIREQLQRKSKEGGNYFARRKSELHFIRSGCQTLDLALGGGWARDHISNIVGDKSTGKTLLCIEACANFHAQYPSGKIRYREVEKAFDESYAQALGMPIAAVDFGKYPLDTVEDLFEDLQYYASRAKHPELYVLDSLDALSDRAELQRGMDEATYGGDKAKKMSQLFRRTVRQLSEAHITLMIVSQVRSRIGQRFVGRGTTRTGGRALDFYSSQVLYLAQKGVINRTIQGIKRPIGIDVRGKCDKNKVAQPFREADFRILFGYGVDDILSSLNFLKEAGALKEVGIKKDQIERYARSLMNDSNGDYEKKVRELGLIVEKYWYEIEERFLPKRSKYSSGVAA